MSPVSSQGKGVTVAEGSAPGKVILFGEHAVVHGKLCVAASLGLRTTCRLQLGQGTERGGARGAVHQPAPPGTGPHSLTGGSETAASGDGTVSVTGAPTANDATNGVRDAGASTVATNGTGAGTGTSIGTTGLETDTETVNLDSPSLGMSFSVPLRLLLAEIRACPTLAAALLEAPPLSTPSSGTPLEHRERDSDRPEGQLERDSGAPSGHQQGDSGRGEGNGTAESSPSEMRGLAVPTACPEEAQDRLKELVLRLFRRMGPGPASSVAGGGREGGEGGRGQGGGGGEGEGEGDSAPETHVMSAAVFVYLLLKILGPRPVSAVVTSELPASAGLGSSASFCVAVAAALLAAASGAPAAHQGELVMGQSPAPMYQMAAEASGTGSSGGGERAEGGGWEGRWLEGKAEGLTSSKGDGVSEEMRALVNAWALEGERIIHGSPSGVDNEVSSQGGILTFQAGRSRPLESALPLRILLSHTRVPRSTRALVAGVGDLKRRLPTVTHALLQGIDAVAHRAVEVIQTGNFPAGDPHWAGELDELVRLNQGLLACLGVSHPRIERVCEASWAAGGVHSKLTGAGGGGCVLTLLPPGMEGSKVKAIKDLLEADGYDTFEAAVGCPGVAMRAR